MIPAAIPSTPSWRERSVAAIARRYPLKSGGPTIANSNIIKFLSGNRTVNLWAEVKGGKALVPVNDLVGRTMYFVGDLDPKISWIVDRFVRPGDVVLDIGANLGLVSLHLAARVGGEGRVHAFEPNPVIRAYLDATVSENTHSPIMIHPIALGEEDTEMSLSVPDMNAGAASLKGDEGRAAYVIQVPVRCLSDYAVEHGISRIDFIKLDVEGFEAEVLEGGREIIERYHPRAILFEEYGETNRNKLPLSISMLIDIGYTVFGLPKRMFVVDMVPLEGLTSAHDYVAVWPVKRKPQ